MQRGFRTAAGGRRQQLDRGSRDLGCGVLGRERRACPPVERARRRLSPAIASASGSDPVAAAAASRSRCSPSAGSSAPPRGRGDRGSCWPGRGRPRQSSSVTASPTRMRPGSSTAASSAILPSKSRTMRRSTPLILLERVGVERGHQPQRAQLHRELDERGADADRPALPLPLREARDAADHDVRPQPPVIDTERAGGAVGEDRQRQDVEALRPRVVKTPTVSPAASAPRPAPRVSSHGSPSISAAPSAASVPCSPSRRGCVRDVTTRPSARGRGSAGRRRCRRRTRRSRRSAPRRATSRGSARARRRGKGPTDEGAAEGSVSVKVAIHLTNGSTR